MKNLILLVALVVLAGCTTTSYERITEKEKETIRVKHTSTGMEREGVKVHFTKDGNGKADVLIGMDKSNGSEAFKRALDSFDAGVKSLREMAQ